VLCGVVWSGVVLVLCGGAQAPPVVLFLVAAAVVACHLIARRHRHSPPKDHRGSRQRQKPAGIPGASGKMMH